MPAAPSGHEYVLWLQHGDTMTEAGVMPEGSDNQVLFSGDAASANAAAVSIEDERLPKPPSPATTSSPLFSFDA